MKVTHITLASLALALAAGCSHAPVSTSATVTNSSQGAPATLAKPAAEAPQAAHDSREAAAPPMTFVTVKGKVAEAIHTDRNTFLLVDTGAGSRWAVLPKVPATVGQQVELRGMLVTGYDSKALNRTFDTIVFSDGLAGSKAAPMDLKRHAVPKRHPSIGR